MNSPETELTRLQDRIGNFAQQRNWEQFHSPKNLVMALSGECGELTAHFQWLKEDESRNLSPDVRSEVGRELADVFIYLLRLAQVLEIDLLAAGEQKMSENENKYPTEKVWGSAKKYSTY